MADKSTDSGERDAIPAATVVIFRRAPDGGASQILMQVRNRALAFAGGMAVFPGGRVDDSDFELARRAGYVDIDESAHQIAAIRETLEETGLALGLRGAIDAESAAKARAMLLDKGRLEPVLAQMGWRIALNDLVPFARWFPKNERLSRIFDTRFYLADLGTGAVEIATDAGENTRLFWASAVAALDAADRGAIDLIFPPAAISNDWRSSTTSIRPEPTPKRRPCPRSFRGWRNARRGAACAYPPTAATLLPRSCWGMQSADSRAVPAPDRTAKAPESNSPGTLKGPGLVSGAPGRIRTSDPLIRSQVLYPAELRALVRRRT